MRKTNLLAGSYINIIYNLLEKPYNPNQLSKVLNYSQQSLNNSFNILQEHGLIYPLDNGLYFINKNKLKVLLDEKLNVLLYRIEEINKEHEYFTYIRNQLEK